MENFRLLVDGYNVLFEAGLLETTSNEGWLNRERNRLLHLLARKLRQADRSSTVVVFDAPRRGTTPSDTVYQEIRVVFARDHAEADDLIEELIKLHPSPKALSVVSTDNRIRRCIQSRQGTSITSDAFLYDIEHRPDVEQASKLDPGQEKKTTTAEQDNGEQNGEDHQADIDVDFWLGEFGLGDKS